MSEQPSQSRSSSRRLMMFVLGLGVVSVIGLWTVRDRIAGRLTANDEPKHPLANLSPAPPGSTTVGGVPLFATWPKNEKPEVVLVLTGQTWGYTSPCGCSRPQKGGLERRANFIASLRDKGWPVVPLDLGDIAPVKKVQEQDLLKYKYTMEALREMGYVAIGLGEYDFQQQLFELFARYTLQNPDAPPVILSANLIGLGDNKQAIPREQMFPGAGKRSMVEAVEVVGRDARGVEHIPVGITAVLGSKLFDEKIKNIDPHYWFLDNQVVLKESLDTINSRTKGAGINVLLYGGGKDEALKTAEAFPDFHVVVCQSVESEPPQFPTLANKGKSFVIQVGLKGQNLGVVGVFKTPNGMEMKYQLVPMTEEFLTPDSPEAEKANKVLQLLEQYRADIKKQNLLAKFTARPVPHPAQIQNPDRNLAYVGSDKCMICHPAEYKVWQESKHSHAMEALEKYARRPGLASTDGECVVCHTTGFGYQTGYTSDEATKHLRHVGCENCHGPGSGHMTNPLDKKLLSALSPWKIQPTDRLPDKETLLKLSTVKPGEPSPVKLDAKQQQTIQAVRAACMKCHDEENDPKFELEKYMPQMWHSGLRAGLNGLPGNAK